MLSAYSASFRSLLHTQPTVPPPRPCSQPTSSYLRSPFLYLMLVLLLLRFSPPPQESLIPQIVDYHRAAAAGVGELEAEGKEGGEVSLCWPVSPPPCFSFRPVERGWKERRKGKEERQRSQILCLNISCPLLPLLLLRTMARGRKTEERGKGSLFLFSPFPLLTDCPGGCRTRKRGKERGAVGVGEREDK